ncbi:MAG: FecR domain-containing protein [Bryobacteraceae bacterium]|jgi:hypothetical protein
MCLRAVAFFALGCLFVPYLSAQSVISTRSGLINFSEGLVFLDGQPLAKKFGTFDRLKNGSSLVTEAGRAEVLLTPNTYLRIGENSSIRMVSDNLSDTQVEVLAGSSMLDSEGAAAGSFVKLIFRDSTIQITKPGRYRVDAEPPQLRVYQGEAEVTGNGSHTKIESSQLLPLDGAPVVKRFTDGADQLLDVWSDERHSMIASNLVSSQAITDPLLDTGTDSAADYLSSLGPYAGYMPLATVPPVMGGYYGYGGLGYGGLGYGGLGYGPLGYPVYGYSFLPVYPGVARPSYSRVLSFYQIRTGIGALGARPISPSMISSPRPVFGARPTPGVHIGGGRAVGHR